MRDYMYNEYVTTLNLKCGHLFNPVEMPII